MARHKIVRKRILVFNNEDYYSVWDYCRARFPGKELPMDHSKFEVTSEPVFDDVGGIDHEIFKVWEIMD